ncbi:MAG: RsmE family RNA methyltransferase [Ilumatobacteraceae bacterium]
MDDVLRRSAAHVLVDDVAAPAPDDATAHHLGRVLRLRDGEVVTVTDGAGHWRACRVSGAGLEIDGAVEDVARPGLGVTIAVAPPKGERLEWLVQKCTEVGVDRIVLLSAERSVVRWDGERAARQLARLRRIAVEASLQARRVWLPELAGPMAAVDVLARALVAEPGGRALGAEDATVAIGPEGGWSPAEVAAAAGQVSLGPNVLRVETAAVVAASTMVAFRSVLR